METLPDWGEIEKRVFSELKNGQFRIGGEKIPDDLRGILRDQAKSFQTSQLWEILNASTINEAISTGLLQSQNHFHTEFGKALWHYANFIRNVVNRLAED